VDLRLGVYRRLFSYLGPYRKRAAIAYSSMILATLLNLAIPQIIAAAIDLGLETGEVSSLFSAAAIILVIGAVGAVLGYGQRYYGEWLTHRVAYDLRNEYYDHVQRQPFEFHDRAQTGDLMSRATSDISETERFVGIGLMDLVATILLLVGVVIAMFLENARLAALALIPLPILVVTTIRFGGQIRPRFKSIQEQIAVLSTTMQESLTGIRVVKAFARESFELQKFDVENERWFHRRHQVIKMWANNWPFFTFTLSMSVFLLLWFGGLQGVVVLRPGHCIAADSRLQGAPTPIDTMQVNIFAGAHRMRDRDCLFAATNISGSVAAPCRRERRWPCRLSIMNPTTPVACTGRSSRNTCRCPRHPRRVMLPLIQSRPVLSPAALSHPR